MFNCLNILRSPCCVFCVTCYVNMANQERATVLLQQELATIINQEVQLEGVLLTVGFVDLSPDLKQARIGISVLPDKFYGTALTAVRRAGGDIKRRLAKNLKWRAVPRLVWEIDSRR